MQELTDRVGTIARFALATATLVACGACVDIPSVHTFSRDYGTRPTCTDPPRDSDCIGVDTIKYDDLQNGGNLFKMYCGSCHNARHLAERPFAVTQVSFAHMRRHAYLTGQEYRQLMHFLRRWHDIGPPTPDVEATPKRVIFAHEITELKQDADGV